MNRLFSYLLRPSSSAVFCFALFTVPGDNILACTSSVIQCYTNHKETRANGLNTCREASVPLTVCTPSMIDRSAISALQCFDCYHQAEGAAIKREKWQGSKKKNGGKENIMAFNPGSCLNPVIAGRASCGRFCVNTRRYRLLTDRFTPTWTLEIFQPFKLRLGKKEKSIEGCRAAFRQRWQVLRKDTTDGTVIFQTGNSRWLPLGF